MSQTLCKLDPSPHRRRFLIHLTCAHESSESRRYVARIELWKSRSATPKEQHERFFADECALVQALNPLLPSGSDVRDVLGHIECSDGFFYLLHLTSEEAATLGWRTQTATG